MESGLWSNSRGLGRGVGEGYRAWAGRISDKSGLIGEVGGWGGAGGVKCPTAAG